MQLFSCPACGARLFFQNHTCLACGAAVALDPVAGALVPPDRPCANRLSAGCNWVAAPDADLCLSCAMTRTIPDLGPPQNAHHWQEAETAKRWVLTGLLRLGWFGPADPGPRPLFDMVAEDTSGGAVAVTMGHADGIITLNVSEADHARIALRQAELGEPYRTVMGHLRHEIAHFLHWRLVGDEGFASGFRALFGDERADYGAALAAHYASPAATGDSFITSYATAHPHEDWAETTAHLLHLLDISDSFAQAGLAIDGRAPLPDPYAMADTARIIEQSGAIGLALNHVNRAMGLADLYPFVLAAPVRDKIAFVHRALNRNA
ncbi:MAG: putative zinc-binding metallopeptidase [Paracoccaceae bacterium]|nr:MAG: putative zinc-binding metallopeptidase [Paracoccaceae bacterium]